LVGCGEGDEAVPKTRSQPTEADTPLPAYNMNLFKEITETYRQPLPISAEIVLADKSLYGWWWRFLKANPDYPPKHEHKHDAVRAEVFGDFGDLRDSFGEWWEERGRHLFSERQGIPLIKLLSRSAHQSNSLATLSLTLEIPMTISREAIIEQLNRVLDCFHPGKELLRHSYSTARRRIFPRHRYRKDKLEILLAVLEARRNDPQRPFWEIGRDLKLAKWLGVDDSDTEKPDAAVRKILGDKVERLHAQAETLAHNAALGQFPRDDRKVTSQDVSPRHAK